MAMTFCAMCNRTTHHLLTKCVEHSDVKSAMRRHLAETVHFVREMPTAVVTNTTTPRRVSRPTRGRTFKGTVTATGEIIPPAILAALGIEPIAPVVGVNCTFCHKPIPENTKRTHGTFKAPVNVSTQIIRNDFGGAMSFQEKFQHTIREAVSCEGCVLLLDTVKYPETD